MHKENPFKIVFEHFLIQIVVNNNIWIASLCGPKQVKQTILKLLKNLFKHIKNPR